MEETGVRTWLEIAGRQAELQQWQRLQTAGSEFNSLIGDIRKDLSELYDSNASDVEKRRVKAELLQGLAVSYDLLRADKWDNKDYFSGWFAEPLNNAKLALFNTYEGGQCAFQNLYGRTKGDMRDFHRLAEQQARLSKDERRIWLEQPCDAIVSVSKL